MPTVALRVEQPAAASQRRRQRVLQCRRRAGAASSRCRARRTSSWWTKNSTLLASRVDRFEAHRVPHRRAAADPLDDLRPRSLGLGEAHLLAVARRATRLTMPAAASGPPLADDEVGGEVAGRPRRRTASARRGRPRGTGRRAQRARRAAGDAIGLRLGRSDAGSFRPTAAYACRSRPSSSMEEQWTFNPLVQGSSPWGGTWSEAISGLR